MEKYNIPEPNSLDSMEGVEYPKNENDQENINDYKNKILKLKSIFEDKLGHRLSSTLTGSEEELPLHQFDDDGLRYEKELRSLEILLAKDFSVAIMLDSILYIVEESNLKDVTSVIDHHLIKILDEFAYIERNKESYNEIESEFVSKILDVVATYYASIPRLHYKQVADYLYSDAIDLLSNDKNPEFILALNDKISQNKLKIEEIVSDDKKWLRSGKHHKDIYKLKKEMFKILEKYKDSLLPEKGQTNY